MVSQDYEDLFKTLNTHKIKYLVIGAHAVVFYTEPRFTKDMDIWVPVELNDPEKIHQALRAFGAPLRGILPADFTNKDIIFQIGVAPVRIDILLHLEGIEAARAWKNRKKSYYGKTPINIIGFSELIKVKKKAGRSIDKIDLKKLFREQKK